MNIREKIEIILMTYYDDDQQDIDDSVDEILSTIKEELLRKLPKKMTMKAALKSHSEVGAGYTIGFNEYRSEVRKILNDKLK